MNCDQNRTNSHTERERETDRERENRKVSACKTELSEWEHLFV